VDIKNGAVNKSKLAVMLRSVGGSLEEFCKCLSSEEVQQAVEIINVEGGFTEEEDELIKQSFAQGISADETVQKLLLFGLGNKHIATVKVRMLQLGLVEKLSEN